MSFGPGHHLWRTVCDIDFTGLTTQNLKSGGNGAKTIAGLAWNLENSANATSIDITNGTGLVIVSNANNSLISGSTRTAPLLSATFGVLFNHLNPRTYSVPAHAVRIMSRVLLTNADATFENGVMLVEDSASPQNLAFGIGKGFNGPGNSITFFATEANAQTSIVQQTTSFTDDVLGLLFQGSDMAEGWTGVYDSAAGRLPYELTTSRDSYVSSLSAPSLRLKGSPRLVLASETANTSGSLTVTFTHLRVDVASAFPTR